MIHKPMHYIYPDADSLAAAAACEFEKDIRRLLEHQEYVNVALSGGSTPIVFFRALVSSNPDIEWKRISFYWGDERCVPPDHDESNYGNADKELLSPLNIGSANVFRIRGEEKPEEEAERYSKLIERELTLIEGKPSFDWMFLGMGADGHTLSIFPQNLHLWDASEFCVVSAHPETGQKRISLTGKVVNAAKRITFFVTGEDKCSVVNRIIFRQENYADYPASLVKPEIGQVEWYLDQPAAKLFA